MYYLIVVGLMFVLPWSSVVVDAGVNPGSASLYLIGKWFVFWAVGVRLLLAGLRQIIQPRYTAETILGLKGDESLFVVRELGFANVAIGAMAAGSLLAPGWMLAGALAGGIFYALAGINHAVQSHRGRLENVAMTSDLLVAGVLLVVYCALGPGNN